MHFFNLDCGRQVAVDAFEYSRTYATLLMGRPNAETNARVIERALSDHERVWGGKKVHLIPPTVDLSDPKHPTFPPVRMRAWLTCYEPIKPEFMASGLVVVWFGDDCHNEPIANTVFHAVRGLPWEKLAHDFDW